MTSGDAFLAAICQQPEDDTARLAYADWLDENDQPTRAAFIRAQIEEMREPECRGDEAGCSPKRRCQRCRLESRAADLIRGNVGEWSKPLPRALGVDDVFYFGNDFHGYPDSCWRFRRGFVEIVAMPATAWLAHEKRLRVVHPIREVWLTQGMTPEEAGRSGGQNVYRIPGRKKKLPRRAGEEWADLLIRLFEAEFPGVRFHSPAEWERANGDHTF